MRKKIRFIVFSDARTVLRQWMEPLHGWSQTNRGAKILQNSPSANIVNISAEDCSWIIEWYRDAQGKLRTA